MFCSTANVWLNCRFCLFSEILEAFETIQETAILIKSATVPPELRPYIFETFPQLSRHHIRPPYSG